MDYKWAKNFALKLINQYSIAGTTVPESYNNQADYLLRIPELVDDAQMCIATTTGRIRKVVPLSSLQSTRQGDWVSCELPKDCWQVCSSGLILLKQNHVQRYSKYHLVGDTEILIPASLMSDARLEYYRYPKLLGSDPRDDEELDNSVAAQMALPYYVAAHIVMHDDSFAYQALYNEFEAKLARLAEMPKAEIAHIEDSYSAAEWEYNEA